MPSALPAARRRKVGATLSPLPADRLHWSMVASAVAAVLVAQPDIQRFAFFLASCVKN